MRLGLALFGLIAVAVVAEAAPVRLSGPDLQAWVAGSVVDIDAPMGGTISVRIAPDGTMTGNSGSLGFFLGGTTDRGQWWIAGDALCKKWSKWFDGDTQCLQVRREGTRIYWRTDEGKEGTATRVAGPPEPSVVAAARPEVGSVPKSVVAVVPDVSRHIVRPRVENEQGAAPPRRPSIVEGARPPAIVKPPTLARRPETAPDRVATAGRAPVSSWRSDNAATAETAARRGPDPRAAARPVASLRVVGVEANDVLWVRRGPGTEFAEVGYLAPHGRRIELVGPCEAEWCRVRYKGLVGWASTYYLAAEADIR